MSKLTYVIAVSLLLAGVSNAYAQETLYDDASYYSQNYDASGFSANSSDDQLAFDGNEVSYYLAGSKGDGILSLFVQANASQHYSSDMSPEDLNNIEPTAGVRLKFELDK